MRLIEFVVTSILTAKKELSYNTDMDFAGAIDQAQLYLKLWTMRLRFIISEVMYASACNQSSNNVLVIAHFLGMKHVDESITDKHVYVTMLSFLTNKSFRNFIFRSEKSLK